MSYIACSSESQEGFCPHVDTSCSAINTCRTCGGFSDEGGSCAALNYFPNATIAEYGVISDVEDDEERVFKIKSEIYTRVSIVFICGCLCHLFYLSHKTLHLTLMLSLNFI